MDSIQCFDGDGVVPPHGMEHTLSVIAIRCEHILESIEAKAQIEAVTADPKRRVILRLAYSTIETQLANIRGYEKSPTARLNPDVFVLLEKAFGALHQFHPHDELRPYARACEHIVAQARAMIL